jgi:DNA-binding transcriptional LysR family regulator
MMEGMLSWDDLRHLLALARAGSLAGAGRMLGVEHTTVGRRIDALEKALGVRLFLRSPTGYTLTDEGELLLPEVARIEASVFALQRAGVGQDKRIAGVVRVTAAETFGARFVAPRLNVALREKYPNICIELLTAVRTLDLSRREADVALRFFRTSTEGVVVRKIGTVRWAVYASEEYVARRGLPTAADLPRHDRIGPGGEDATTSEDQWFETRAAASPCVLRTNSTACMLSAVLAGVGVTLLPCFLGSAQKSLVRVPFPDEPTRDLYLTVHRDAKDTPRVRAVLDVIVAMVEENAALLDGRAAPSEKPAPKLKPKSR